jgi:hypothetical protein
MGLLDDAQTPAPTAATLGRIATLLDRNGIDIDEVGRITRVSLYQSLTKNADGEAEIHDLLGLQLAPAWADGPAWQPVDRGPAHKVPKPATPRPAQYAAHLIVPDIQIGYYRTADGLEPTHDPAAVDIAVAIAAHLKPATITLLGDVVDLPEQGKYRLSPAFANTTQAAVDYLTELAARLRACTTGPIRMLAGNHEERLPNYLLDNARAAFGLRQGRPTGNDWPVMSIPHLCRFDEAAVEYLPGYPASSFWLTPTVKIVHGDKVNSAGSSASRFLTGPHSVIYGHVHRRELLARTVELADGHHEIWAASPGCLARIDGAVPSHGGGIDLDGRPIRRHENWTQGCGIVWHDAESGHTVWEQISISDGMAWWQGKTWGTGTA